MNEKQGQSKVVIIIEIEKKIELFFIQHIISCHSHPWKLLLRNFWGSYFQSNRCFSIVLSLIHVFLLYTK